MLRERFAVKRRDDRTASAFPTDMQAQYMALMTQAEGVSNCRNDF
jgi:UDP-N-acetylglucosamine enolpyruvyl transferase